ncbi:sensor histidine kinase [Pedobacter sp. UBA5917]|jgi:signal transduction histidine kinase|uniref:ATP-binding protein n=1 Tax=Pedobacter sp. UBA5917 TaxID=1947061 RepID=UPI002600818C|nr:sensor histidine kinase [Pedobacter sp. UBA5917]
MKYYTLILLLLIFCHLTGKAQLQAADQQYTDSLNRIINGSTADSLKAVAGFKLTDFWAEHDSTKAVFYLKNARKQSRKYPLLFARSYWFESLIYIEKDYVKAEKLLIRADSLLTKFSTKYVYRLRSMVWHNYALIQQHKDDLKTTLDILINRVLPLSKKAGDKEFTGTEYVSIGTIFTNIGQYDKAAPYLQNGLNALKDASPDKYYLLVNVYISISQNYYHQKNYSQTKKYLDLAKTILDKSDHVRTGYPMAIFWLDYYKSTTRYFINTNQKGLALVDANKAIKLAEELNDNYTLQEIVFEKYRILFEQKKFDQAKKTLLQIVNQPEINTLATNKLKLTESLSEVNYALGNIKEAYQLLKKSKTLSDSLNEGKTKEEINALEIKYKDAENQKKIAHLNAERKQHAVMIEKNKITTLLLVAASFFLLVIIALLYFYFNGYKKLAEQRAINYRQKVADLQQKQQLEISRAMLNAEEKERNRVAQDLHDGLGGMLSGLKINLSNWAKHSEMQLHDVELQRIVNQLDSSVTELRHIARNMMPQTLLKFGLEVALKDLAESAMGNNMHIDFQALNISKNIALEEQIIIYRIVQEILTNILKHARADEVVLQCSENEKHFYITIEDNGTGFDTSTYKKGMGIENIKNRVAYLKGSLEIDSKPGNGTNINIEIPISYE